MKLGTDGAGSPFDPQVEGYFSVAERLLSAAIKDLLAPQRELVLRRLHLFANKAMPSFRRATLEDGAILKDSSGEIHGELFGPSLRAEMAEG